MMKRLLIALAMLTIAGAGQWLHGLETGDAPDASLTQGLAGHWPLKGDARDQSGQGNHGRSHNGADQGSFDGRQSYVEIPASDSLNLGRDDFTLAAWVWTPPDTDKEEDWCHVMAPMAPMAPDRDVTT